jgi:hypothetical protein
LGEIARRTYATGSFAADINPLFRDMDISHMKSFGVDWDEYTYMSNPNNGIVFSRLFRRATVLPWRFESGAASAASNVEARPGDESFIKGV